MIRVKVILLICILITSCNLISKEREDLAQIEKNKFEKILKDKTDYTYEMAKLISLDKDIVTIYTMLKSKVGDVSNIRNENKDFFYRYGNELKEVFLTKMRVYEGAIDVPLSFYFFLYPARLWVLPELPKGDDIPLEDLSKVRPYILEIMTKSIYSSDYEVMPDGVFYRTIMPIWSEDGKTLGAIEVRVEISNILINYLQSHQDKSIIVFIDERYKNILKKSKANLLDTILYFSNIELSNNEFVEIYKRIRENKKINYKGKNFFVVSISDNKGHLIGYILISIS